MLHGQEQPPRVCSLHARMCLVLGLGADGRPLWIGHKPHWVLLVFGRDGRCLASPRDHPLLVPSPPLFPGPWKEVEGGDRRTGPWDLVGDALGGDLPAAGWDREEGPRWEGLEWERGDWGGRPGACGEVARGRTMCKLRLKALPLPHAPLCHQTSLIKHKFKEEIIKNFKMMTAEH